MTDSTYQIDGQLSIEPDFIKDVRDIAREEAQNVNENISEEAIVELNERVGKLEAALEALDTGSGGGGDVSEEFIREIARDAVRGELGPVYDPARISRLNTGDPHGEMHTSTGWGPVYEAEERCVFRGADVDADERGTVTFRIYELSSGDFEADLLNNGEPYRTKEFEVYGGVQHLDFDLPLDEGFYFFEKDSHLEGGPGDDENVALRRPPDAPDGINDGEAPLTWLRGWHPDYRESVDRDAYGRFQSGDWGSNYHYLFSAEIGHSGRGDD